MNTRERERRAAAAKERQAKRQAELAGRWVKGGGVLASVEYVEREKADLLGSLFTPPHRTTAIKLTRATMEALAGLRASVLDWHGGCMHYVEDEGHMDVNEMRHLQRLGILELRREEHLECHYDREKAYCYRPILDRKAVAVARSFDERDIARWHTPEVWGNELESRFGTYRGWEKRVSPPPSQVHLEMFGPVVDRLKATQEPASVTIIEPDGRISGYALNPNLSLCGLKPLGWILSRQTGMSAINYARCKAAFQRLDAGQFLTRQYFAVSSDWCQQEKARHRGLSELARETVPGANPVNMDPLYDAILMGAPVQVRDVLSRLVDGSYPGGYQGTVTFQLVDFQPNDPETGWRITDKTPLSVYRGYFDRLVPVYRDWSTKRNEHPEMYEGYTAPPIYYWTGGF